MFIYHGLGVRIIVTNYKITSHIRQGGNIIYCYRQSIPDNDTIDLFQVETLFIIIIIA